MDTFMPILGSFMKLSFEVIIYAMVVLTFYYYVYKPIANLIFQMYYAGKFHSIPSHPIYGHVKNLIPKFPDPNYKPEESTKNLYNLMMESNDPVKGSQVAILWIGWFPIYLVSSSTGMEAVFTKSNLSKPSFYKFMGLGEGLVTSDTDKWRVHRKIIEPFFKTKRHQHFLSVMDREISKIPKAIMDKIGEPYDIENFIHASALEIIMEVGWGVPCGEAQKVKDVIHTILENAEKFLIQRMVNPLFWADWIYNMLEAGKSYQKNLELIDESVKSLNNYAAEVIGTVNNNNTDKDQTSLYEFLHCDGSNGKYKIDQDGISEELATLIAAGHETTSVGMRWTLFTLGNNPEVQERLYQEIVDVFPDNTPVDKLDKLAQCKYLDQCLKESLRLNPPIHAVARQLDEDIVVNGSKIYKNSVVIANFSATHRDPKVYPDPLKYNPDRWLPGQETTLPKGSFVAFALGPRNCIGYRYALLEMKVYLIHIIRRFKLKSLRKNEDIECRFEIALKPNSPLEIIFTPRK